MRGRCPFERHYRRLVTPRLVSAIRAEAAHVLFGTYDFATACDEVMLIAWLHGAHHFNDDRLHALQDWIIDQLGNVLDEEFGP